MSLRGERRWVVCVLALFLCSQSAFAELSYKQLRRTAKKADQAWAKGRMDEAQRLYTEILQGSKPGDPSRQNALYAVLMARLATAAEIREEDAVLRLLAEIKESFPAHPRKLELAAVEVWMAEVAAVRQQAAENAAQLQALRSEIEETVDEAGGQVKSCEEKLNSTKRSLRSVRAELAKKEEELGKKEEALQKLKNAVVGGGGK